MSKAHTPGPWQISESGLTTNDGQLAVLAGENRIALVDAPEAIDTKQRDRWRIESPTREANARLIAAAPDHALIGWAVFIAAGSWEPWGDGRGEFCINGMRFATELDEFGCPVVTEPLRAAISKAKGGDAS